MQKEQLITLAERYLAKTATPWEQEQLHQWYDAWQDDEEQVLTVDTLTAAMVKERIYKYLQQEIAKEQQLVVAPPVHRVHFLRTSWFRYAAVIILVAGVSGYAWFGIIAPGRNSKKQLAQTNAESSPATGIAAGSTKAILTLANGKKIELTDKTNGRLIQADGIQVTTPNGGQYQLILPDGSKAWLNAASSIKFPAQFKGKERQVEVTGEVYIEVQKNKEKPFIVSTPQSKIQVLGTSFNVNAYQDEPGEKTTLVEGSIKVIPLDKGGRREAPEGLDAPAAGSILTPGQQSLLKNNQLTILNNQYDAIAWKNGYFNFENTDIYAIMRQLARWYDIEVKYSGKLPELDLKGKIDRGLNLNDMLDFLKELNINYKLEGRTLTLSTP